MKHLGTSLIVALISLGAWADQPPSSCKVQSRTSHLVFDRSADSFDECVNSASQIGWLDVSVQYSGSAQTHTHYLSDLRAEVDFRQDGHRIEVNGVQMESSGHRSKSRLTRRERKARMDALPSGDVESASSWCKLTCTQGLNITRQYAVENFDACIDLAGEAGCATLKYEYRGTEGAGSIVANKIAGKLSFKGKELIAKVQTIQIEGENEHIRAHMKQEAQERAWAEAESKRSPTYSSNPDWFGVDTMRAAEFMKFGM